MSECRCMSCHGPADKFFDMERYMVTYCHKCASVVLLKRLGWREISEEEYVIAEVLRA